MYPDEITTWITTTYPDTKIASAMDATFYSLNDQAWPNFATIATTDEHDMGAPSNLAREGVFDVIEPLIDEAHARLAR